MVPSGQHYKVKLASGRILGPLDLERVRLFILKNQIVGTEVAREHPNGEWRDINTFPEIADLIVARAERRLEKDGSGGGSSRTQVLDGNCGPTQVLPGAEGAAAATLVQLDGEQEQFSKQTGTPSLELQDPMAERTLVLPPEDRIDPAAMEGGPDLGTHSEEEERTRVLSTEERLEDEARHRLEGQNSPGATQEEQSISMTIEEPVGLRNPVAEAPTVVFQRSVEKDTLPGKKRPKISEILRAIVVAVVLGVVGYEFLLDEPKPQVVLFTPIRPTLPGYADKADPQLSGKIYSAAMGDYVQDTVAGYRMAADKLRKAVALDQNNVKAVAMLASSYLNLIDASNKDENYFAVISKLIEMSRAKNVELPETVIADVEFYITANKPEAAQNRIVEYTKTHQNFGMEMFYYIALSFYARGDAQAAARYLNQVPEGKAFSGKVYYLRGQIAERLGDLQAAYLEYEKAFKLNKNHAKSRLRLAALLNQKGQLKDAAPHLDFLVTHQALLAPKDLSEAYYLHAQLSQLYQKQDVALGDMERAVKLDRENHDYLLELYTLRAKAGDKVVTMKADARMYFFLGQGEKLLRAGKVQEALTEFLLARQANDRSPLPPIKIGDMFARMHDLGNARVNYRIAAERAPNSIEVWSKYIDVLIQSYEWDEAQKAMDKFRKLPVPQSAIDKAAADMYEKQGRHVEAQTFYRKAMARDTIDPGVYIAYAKSLMATRNFKEAPFLFALALRFDPLNTDAIIGTAKCVAATESIDRAISMLQDELQKDNGAKAEFLAAIAEFQIQKGEWEQAQANVEQAKASNPDYAYPWKLQAQIFMNKEGQERGALDKALFSYQSYSERNPSDPSGYLERYRIFIKKTEFDKAGDELSKIYGIYPKYPNLHYYKGALYSVMKNHKVSIEEYLIELQNNPGSVPTMIALGREFLELRAPQDALKYLNQAMAAAPKNADAKQEAAYANYLLKNFAGAIALYQSALALDQANPIIYKRMGTAFRDGGDPINASLAFRKYLEMEPDAPDKDEIQRYIR